MLKLDTHSIQMIAICTILLSTIFLGYLEFKRLHYKLDSIADNLKTIEDLKTIKNKSKLQDGLSLPPLPDKRGKHGKHGKSDKHILSATMTSLNVNNKVRDENIVNKIFSRDFPVNMDTVTLEPENHGTGVVESYDNLDPSIMNELDNLDNVEGNPSDR